MKKPLINIFVVLQALITVSVFSQQTMVRPRIGLALSGGGAKGLAHIGILKAIDSAGLKIDYITGTSMGSIIGGLYAVGYSADSIEKITRATNWELLLSNQSSLRTLYMEEKEEYNKYTIELPWVKNRFELPTGLLQGQEIWVKLAELLFPVYNQKDFSKFSIPFRCVATDVGNGEAVVLGKGELSSAIRASMAIPSLFTAVEYDGRKLIDGGVIRNFPVKDVQELGADFVIGSNAAQTLLPSDKVRNAIQVLLQVAFFREAQDHKEEIAKCDIYVSPDLSKYNMVSFGQSGEILDAGIAEGRKLYPKLKKLVDSLDAIYGKQAETKKQLPVVKSVIISSCEVKGLKNTNTDFFIHTINFLTNQAYTSQKLSKMVRAAFGTRYYSRIVYSLEPQSDGTCKIIFDVTENPLTFAKFGLHYNRFSGIAAIVNVTSRNLLLPNSRSLVTLNIGEAIRARAEHLQYIGRRKNFSFLLGMQYDRFNVLTYNTYKQDGLYKQQFFKADIKAQFSTQRNLTIGIGHRVESVKYKPKIIPAFQFSGSNIFGSTYFFIQHNSLDKIIYPGNGIRINSTFEYVGNQHPSVSFFINGIPVRSDSLKVSKKPYTRATFNMDAYKQLSRRTTAEFLIQSGINFNYSNNIMNEFVIGGLTRQFRNQVLFAGLLEGSLYSPAVAAIQTGLRYEVLNNTFVTCRGNILFNNFISKSDFFSNPDVATGYSVTFGYNFALGPLEFSLMYNDQSKKVNGYVNIGIAF